MTKQLTDGRVICTEGLSGWLYASETARQAWDTDGDDSGLIDAVECGTAEELAVWVAAKEAGR
jgi:hypothetical protein